MIAESWHAERTAEDLNDDLAQSSSREQAESLCGAAPLRFLRAVCDLNYLDETGNRSALTARIVNDIYGKA